MGFPGGSDGKETTCNTGDPGPIPGSGRFPWRREWPPTPVFLPGEFYGQRSMVGYTPVQLLSRIRLFATLWTAACQASLFIINSQSLLKLMSVESVIPSNHLTLCLPLLLLPSIFSQHRDFSNESVLHIMWPKYYSFSSSISPSNEYSGLISFRIDWFDLLQFRGLSRVFSNTTVQKHQFFSAQLSF